MKAIAIDDESAALGIIRSFSLKVPYLNLSQAFIDAFEAINYLQKEPVDLLFLDIKMPDISGIELIQSLSFRPLVIFTTAYSEHAVTGFELDAVDYLLKPFSFARFLKSCNKANELLTSRSGIASNDFVFIKTGYEQVKLFFADLYWIESDGNYLNFVLQDKSYLSRMTFGEIEELLPKTMFVRVHRCYIVSFKYIDKIERHQVHIKGSKIPVSGSYIENLKERIRNINR